MSDSENNASANRGEGSGLFDSMPPELALKTLANLQLEESRIVAPLKNRSRLANQVYDLVQSFLTGARATKDTYYPSLTDIYSDLQMHKRAISDKTPMPDEAELLRTVCLMSVQSPPFLHILREIPNHAESPVFISRLVAPTEKHPDKVSVAYRATLRNNLVQLKGMMRNLDPDIPGGPAFNRLQDVNPRAGRVETLLGAMFFPGMGGDASSPPPEDGHNDEITLKRVNQGLRIKLFRPLVMDLIREKMIFSLSCQEIRQQTGLKLPDIVLFNILENVKQRFSRLCEILTHDGVIALLDSATASNVQRFLHSNHLQDAAEAAAHSLLEHSGGNGTIPIHIAETAAEMIRLREWYDHQSKAQKQDQQKQEIQSLLQKIQAQKGIFRAKNGRKIHIDEKYLNLLLNESNSPVLVAADPPLARSGQREAGDYETIYLLYKDRNVTGQAAQTALDAYEKTGDAFLLRILEDLLQINTKSDQELKQYVPPAYLEQIREAIRDTYKVYLSPLERLWLAFTGNRISDEKIARIRRRLDMERSAQERSASEKKSKARSRKARQDVKTLARQRAEAGPVELAEQSKKQSEAAGFDHAAQEVLNLLLSQVNQMWDKNFYPNRDQVLRLASANEKEIAEKVLGLVDAGAQSTAAMIRIPVPGKGYVYGGNDYVHLHRQDLIERFKRKLDAGEAVQVSGGATIQLNTKEEDRQFYRAMLQYLNHLPVQ
ncbi:MAG: hypothetical protein KDK23_11600 [Leptospiraceae bacterium]|nr:hypothetical protein [Leptospiraceae bacterium]